MLSFPARDVCVQEAADAAPDSQIHETHIADDAVEKTPDSVNGETKRFDDERRQEECDGDLGDEGGPIEEDVPGKCPLAGD